MQVINGVTIDAGPDDWLSETLAAMQQQQAANPPIRLPERRHMPAPPAQRPFISPYGLAMRIDAPPTVDGNGTVHYG